MVFYVVIEILPTIRCCMYAFLKCVPSPYPQAQIVDANFSLFEAEIQQHGRLIAQ